MRNARVLCGVLILAYAWALGAWAAGASESGVASCRRITDDKQRLACFDRESASEQQQPTASQRQQPTRGAATRAARAPASPVLSPEQRIGLDPARILKLEGSKETRGLKELTAKIRSVSGDVGSRRYFTLENGQVWRQVDAEPDFTIRPGDTVRITKAMFGSYFLSANPHMSTRVYRAR